jgi:hypothetical protein
MLGNSITYKSNLVIRYICEHFHLLQSYTIKTSLHEKQLVQLAQRYMI